MEQAKLVNTLEALNISKLNPKVKNTWARDIKTIPRDRKNMEVVTMKLQSRPHCRFQQLTVLLSFDIRTTIDDYFPNVTVFLVQHSIIVIYEITTQNVIISFNESTPANLRA